MKLDDKFYELLFSPEVEGEKVKAYQDSIGVWTIGAGTTVVDGKPVYKGMTCTKEQAIVWAKKDCVKFEQIVNNTFDSILTKLNQNMFNALGLFCYNCGSFANAKTLVGVIKGNPFNFDRIQNVWSVYCKAHDKTGAVIVIDGLKNRRLFEFKLYKS